MSAINPFCSCAEDGWCPRYQKPMYGRWREICAAVNCDLGTSASFRALWAQEASLASPAQSHPPIPLILSTAQAPGDAVAMTAAIYSLHKSHPGKYLTAVESQYPDVFAHNPDVVPSAQIPNALPLAMHYPAIHQSNERGIHFLQGWCEHLSSSLDIPVPLLTNRPHLYFTDIEPHIGGYWVICAGGKNDITNKLWGHHNYQRVIQLLEGKVKFIQVGEKEEEHPYLSGVSIYHVGKSTLRQLFEIVRRARGVLCGVSLLMHVAAALNRPAVVVAGGREPVQWNSYSKQQYVHTVGALPCNPVIGDVGNACWRARVVPLGDGTSLDDNTCQRPLELRYAGMRITTIPECMYLIKPEEIANLVLRCDRQGEGNMI